MVELQYYCCKDRVWQQHLTFTFHHKLLFYHCDYRLSNYFIHSELLIDVLKTLQQALTRFVLCLVV